MKYTKEILYDAVSKSTSIMQVMKFLGITKTSGSLHSHIKRQIKKFNIDISHFTGQGWAKGKTSGKKQHWSEILILKTSGHREKPKKLRRALIESGTDYKCYKCNNTGVWLGKILILEIDHINENFLDNRKENLMFLCPNCHRIKNV